MDLCLPDMDVTEQFRLTWYTNAVKCSAHKSGGRIPGHVSDNCVNTYLKHELAALPNAFVIALGRKAERRMQRNGIKFDAFAFHPSARDQATALQTWVSAAEAFKRAKSSKA